jgi:hypothetical protein
LVVVLCAYAHIYMHACVSACPGHVGVTGHSVVTLLWHPVVMQSLHCVLA